MELEETVRGLKKRVDSSTSSPDVEKKTEENSAMSAKVHEMNQKLIKQMTQMNEALNYCQKEKDEIIEKSEKVFKFSFSLRIDFPFSWSRLLGIWSRRTSVSRT